MDSSRLGFVIRPSVDDELGARVVTKKQPKPQPDPGAPPVPELRPHRVALPVLISGRVIRHGLEDQFGERVVELDVGVVLRGRSTGGRRGSGLNHTSPTASVVNWAKTNQ